MSTTTLPTHLYIATPRVLFVKIPHAFRIINDDQHRDDLQNNIVVRIHYNKNSGYYKFRLGVYNNYTCNNPMYTRANNNKFYRVRFPRDQMTEWIRGDCAKILFTICDATEIMILITKLWTVYSHHGLLSIRSTIPDFVLTRDDIRATIFNGNDHVANYLQGRYVHVDEICTFGHLKCDVQLNIIRQMYIHRNDPVMITNLLSKYRENVSNEEARLRSSIIYKDGKKVFSMYH